MAELIKSDKNELFQSQKPILQSTFVPKNIEIIVFSILRYQLRTYILLCLGQFQIIQSKVFHFLTKMRLYRLCTLTTHLNSNQVFTRGVYSGQGVYFFPPSSFQSAYFLPQIFFAPPPPLAKKNGPPDILMLMNK